MKRLSKGVIYGRRALHHNEPWIVPEAFKHLKKIVQPDWRVFEWGSGGSTIWLAQNCASVISVEQSKRWFIRANKKLAELDIRNTIVKLVLDGSLHANAILVEPGEFDLIFVDGKRKHRPACMTTAVTKLKPNGVIMIDNSNWFGRIIDRIFDENWQRLDFKSPKYRSDGKWREWWTSFYWQNSGDEL